MAERQSFFRFPGVLLVLPIMFVLYSCGWRDGSGLKRHDLFTIPLGNLPGEMDWFYRNGFRMAGTADIQTRDGLIFISGGEAGKVLVFNSYGDLLTFVHDPKRNPAPAPSDSGEGTRSISTWSFRTLRSIAAYEGGFLVDDGVEPERRVSDPEFGELYDRVVLRFSQDGDYLGHLGREGFGGSPFPYISTIDIRQDGGIVVTCRIPGAWMSYWYNKEGRPITTVRIPENQLPGLLEGGNVAVYSVRPDPSELKLHIRLDVYERNPDGERPDPRLYTLNLTTLIYEEPITLTYNTGIAADDVPAIPPEHLGTTAAGGHVMLAPEGPESYRLTIVDKRGRVVQNRRIRVDADATVYRRFHLENDGLLAGIFVGSEGALVSWWRVDRLLGNDG